MTTSREIDRYRRMGTRTACYSAFGDAIVMNIIKKKPLVARFAPLLSPPTLPHQLKIASAGPGCNCTH